MRDEVFHKPLRGAILFRCSIINLKNKCAWPLKQEKQWEDEEEMIWLFLIIDKFIRLSRFVWFICALRASPRSSGLLNNTVLVYTLRSYRTLRECVVINHFVVANVYFICTFGISLEVSWKFIRLPSAVIM